MIWFAKATPPLRSTFRSSKVLITAGSLAQPLAGASQDHPVGRTTGARGTARTKWSLGAEIASIGKNTKNGGFFGDVVQNSFFNHEHIGILSYEISGNRTDE